MTVWLASEPDQGSECPYCNGRLTFYGSSRGITFWSCVVCGIECAYDPEMPEDDQEVRP